MILIYLLRDNSVDSTHYVMLFFGNAGSIHAPTNEYLESPTINVSEYDSMIVEMDHWLRAYLPYTGDAVIEAWNGTAWSTVYFHAGLLGNIGANYKPEHVKGFSDWLYKCQILNFDLD
jgi:hypothetical protein